MSINGKRDHFVRNDFKVIGRNIGIKNVNVMIDQVIDVVARWPVYAKNAGLDKDKANKVSNGHRVSEFA